MKYSENPKQFNTLLLNDFVPPEFVSDLANVIEDKLPTNFNDEFPRLMITDADYSNNVLTLITDAASKVIDLNAYTITVSHTGRLMQVTSKSNPNDYYTVIFRC